MWCNSLSRVMICFNVFSELNFNSNKMFGMTVTAKAFYLMEKLMMFTKLGTLIPPLILLMTYSPLIYLAYTQRHGNKIVK